jgi:hypothetical protein
MEGGKVVTRKIGKVEDAEDGRVEKGKRVGHGGANVICGISTSGRGG